MPKPPRSPILDIRDLRITRDGTQILRGISWSVTAGQHWVILGSNGSGKTSLLSSLTGYLPPTSGEVHVLGQRYGRSDWRDLRTRVGLVSSSIRQMMADADPAVMTVVSGKYAMIDFWGKPAPGDRAAALRILRKVEAEYLAKRRWQVLSQGERQRVLIGRALMAKPELLILDEPCAGLDPVAREHFLEFLQRLGSQRGSPALILVTHHIEEIMPVFTHVLLLREGEALAAGEKEPMLNSENLAAVFGAKCKLSSRNERYSLTIMPTNRD